MAGTVGSWAIDDTEEIGSGGFGSVLKARHLQSGEVAAAKHIIHEHMRLAAIQHEAGLMKRCEHPHVVRLYEYLQLEKESYLFMELAEGGELFSRVLDDGNLDEGVARSYFAQLMDAVDYLHGQGIAHRDLKLENVLLSSSNECKICDFGLAHLYKDLKREPLYEVCGSKSYAAPEILASRGYDGYSVDVWSCGIVRSPRSATLLAMKRPHSPLLARPQPGSSWLRGAPFTRGSLVRRPLGSAYSRCWRASFRSTAPRRATGGSSGSARR